MCKSSVLEIISCWKGTPMPKQIAKYHRDTKHGRNAQHVKPMRGRKRARVNMPAMQVARIANAATAKQQRLGPNAYTGLAEDIVE